MDEQAEPKKRNAVKTRARILDAAYCAFALHGYAKTGIREVAENADVATSLILRYFGNKANLFREAYIFGIHKDSLFTREREKFGQRMAKLILNDSDTNLTAMTVLALADPESQDVAKKVTLRHVIEPLAEFLGPPDAEARAMSLYVLMTGFTIQKRMLEKSQIPPEAVKWLAGAMQQIVDQT